MKYEIVYHATVEGRVVEEFDSRTAMSDRLVIIRSYPHVWKDTIRCYRIFSNGDRQEL